MELPADVLGLVRAFSKPRMRFYKEYRQSLTQLGFAPHEHWILLRDKLCTSEAELVFAAFLVYKEAKLAVRGFHDIPWKGPYYIYHDELEKLLLLLTQLENTLHAILVSEGGS
jgi:hypothetical protein